MHTSLNKNSNSCSTSGQDRTDLKVSIRTLSSKCSSAKKTIKIKKLSKQATNHVSKLKPIGKTIETFTKALTKDVIEWFPNKYKLPKSNSTDTVTWKMLHKIFKTQRPCYNESRQRWNNSYSRRETIYIKG